MPDPQPGDIIMLDGAEKSRRVSAMFGRIAGRYDLMNTVMTGGMHHVWRAMAARIALEQVGGGDVLDVATGTGDFAIALARRPEVRRAVGLDFAPPMLAIAARKARRRRTRAAIDFVTGDALQLPFGDERFAAVTVGWGLRNFADLTGGLMELVRVLQPGGRLVILDMTPRSANGPLSRALRLYTDRLVPLLGSIAGDREAYSYLPESVHHFPGAGELMARMTQAGLANARYRLLGFGAVALHYGDKIPTE